MTHFPALDAKRAELKTLLDAHGVGPETKGSDFAHLPADAVEEVKRLNREIGHLEEVQAQAERAARGGGAEPGSEPGGGGFKAHSGSPAAQWAAKAADQMQAAAKQAGVKALTSGSIDIPTLISTDVVALPTNGARLIDVLIDREQLATNTYEFLRQTVRTSNAAPVADHAQKPQSTFTVTPVEDRARVIAHLSEPIPERFFSDYRALVRWLEAEMFTGVLDAVEAQIVNGDGLGENITGILNTTGILAQPFVTSVPTTLRKARTQLESANEMPTAVVLNPGDMEILDLLQSADGEFLAVAGYANIFGDLRRVTSTSVPSGTALLGDFAQIRLYTREQMRLDADRSGDLFKRNEVVMRAEGRFGIGVLRPSAFVEIDLTA